MTAVRELMTTDPLLVQRSATMAEAAMAMAGADVGDVLVLDGDELCGIVTDRDITVRGVALSKDPQQTRVDELASTQLVTVQPDTDYREVVKMAREKAIRRFPVVEGAKPVGIVSIGDMAIMKDPDSALADISAAPPNT